MHACTGFERQLLASMVPVACMHERLAWIFNLYAHMHVYCMAMLASLYSYVNNTMGVLI